MEVPHTIEEIVNGIKALDKSAAIIIRQLVRDKVMGDIVLREVISNIRGSAVWLAEETARHHRQVADKLEELMLETK